MSEIDIVLGAGMAGFGAYYANSSMELYEKNDRPGGLCGSFMVDGFRFDQAVHMSFTSDETVRSVFDRTPYYTHVPKPYSWFHERWLRHPAQNNLFPLPAAEKVKAVKSFLERPCELHPTNFAEWNRNCYGQWLWENLFKPYNEKYWCVPLEELGVDWTGVRFYQPTVDEVLYGSYTNETPNTYYAKQTRYPKSGGFCSFLTPLINQAESAEKIHYRKKVVRILPAQRKVCFADGEEVCYRRLYSSLPLTEMMEMTDGVPDALKEKAGTLECTGVALVSLGLKRCAIDKLWIYIYDRDIMSARAYFPFVKSKNNVPEGLASVQFEIYFNNREKAPDKETCVKNCLYAVEKLGIAQPDDVLFSDYRVVPYGNVICKKDTAETAAKLTAWLEGVGITPIGRFGCWDYLWSDQAFMSGFNAVIRNVGE